ncbi:undecaprenyl/decaprenyl-phosphate alpha-N-acetylglucosaminyl 1-phosphate transferase [Salibacteraceae bacterium]|jgi:UDP-GlcNAc:undecaprenyl-phosphate GlcNAc-1-phosphate transferase|nr:undecaprenyl/decaprenyl-phosphate alpha-N-acetylglucosaminyl 1-phosphate transferase [Salibacteraceae bacterium]MDA9267122.1 undecaprenyl/decaprenyl-phosphate alpha-N-acetylglucosaminyl 1-phosphate transferase [Salibacteraceae bacterium]
MSITSLILVFILFAGLSALFNFLFLKWTKTLGTKNLAPAEELRWSSSYKPAIGGISFYIIFLVSYVVYLFLNNPEFMAKEELTHLGVLIVVTLGFFTGLADDAFNTVPWLKLSAQIACGIIMLLFDVRIEFFENIYLDSFLTIFWTVAVMNSINMLDNMDGITTIVSIFILLAAAIGSGLNLSSNFFYTFICGGTVSALAGFLLFNWHPSKIFMGDTGSQMIGALLAAIGIIFFWNNELIDTQHTWYSKLALVITAFVIPIADSLTVTINRMRRGQSPFVGGKDHTTHHLSYAGLSDRQVALVMISISTLSLTLITWLYNVEDETKTWLYSVLLIYSSIVIAFLYSSTLWIKSKTVFESKYSK